MKHFKEVEIRMWTSYRKRLKIFDIERLEWLENHTDGKPISPFSLVKEHFLHLYRRITRNMLPNQQYKHTPNFWNGIIQISRENILEILNCNLGWIHWTGPRTKSIFSLLVFSNTKSKIHINNLQLFTSIFYTAKKSLS